MDFITLGLGLAKLTGLDEKIGRWIGGDNGEAVARQVVDIAQKVTGSTDTEKAIKQIQADPNMLLEFEKQLQSQEFELEKMAYADRADARAMQVAAMQNGDKFTKRFIYYFATAWSLFAFAYLAMITFADIPAANVRFADTVLGFLLGTVLAGMFGFFYGSSAGNERRSEQQDLHQAISAKLT